MGTISIISGCLLNPVEKKSSYAKGVGGEIPAADSAHWWIISPSCSNSMIRDLCTYGKTSFQLIGTRERTLRQARLSTSTGQVDYTGLSPREFHMYGRLIR